MSGLIRRISIHHKTHKPKGHPPVVTPPLPTPGPPPTPPIPSRQPVAVLNSCTVLTDAQIAAVIPALQQWHDMVAAGPDGPGTGYGHYTSLSFVPKGQPAPASAWWITLLDNSDQAGALGYHDVTPTGQPLSKVFAGTDLQVGASWTVTISHEAAEMGEDPTINKSVTGPNGWTYAYEVCDAPESDQYALTVGGQKFSDWVYPGWFDQGNAGKGLWLDPQHKIKEPFQLLPGGYIGVDKHDGNGWTQITAEGQPHSFLDRPRVGSRRERRRTPREHWVASEPRDRNVA